MIGKTIKERYKIYDKVGSGGVATVYIARDLHTYEVVAVKLLKTEFTENPNYTKRFMREAEVVSNLHHPNITAVKDYGIEENQYYMVMEYVEGKMLAQIVEEKGALAYPEAINVISQTLEALQYAWENGIVAHRDIKPQNIMLDKNGKVKVMDFGIARVSTSHTMTQAGTFLGTPYYMSPEQAQGKETDIRSDIYSIGITLYQLITGRVPFDADTPWSVVNMHITQAPPMISIPQPYDRLCQVIDKALAKHVQERYQTPQEMLMELNYIIQESQTGFSQQAIEQVGEISIQTNPPGAKVWINQELKGITPTIVRNLPPKKVKVILEKEGYKTEEKTCNVIANQCAMLGVSLKQFAAPPTIPAPSVKDSSQTIINPVASQPKMNANTNQTVISQYQNQSSPYQVGQNYPVSASPRSNKNIFIILGASILALFLIGLGIMLLRQNGTNVSQNTPNNYLSGNNTNTPPPITTKGQITVLSTPSGGDILLNGSDIQQKTPYTITELDAGAYEVKVIIEGETLQKQITLTQGGKETVSLEKKNATENVLDITSDPSGAEVIIDGKNTNLKTPTQVKGLSGVHELELTLAGYESYTMTVNISGHTPIKGVLIPSKNPMGKLVISSNPTGATVIMNGQSIGVTPIEKTVSAGVYQIEISLEGYQTFKGTATVKENETKTIQATLTKKPVTPPPTTPVKEWAIKITSQPAGAKIYINNQYAGVATPTTLKFKPGTYVLKVVLSGYKDQTRTVTYTNSAPNSTTIHFVLEKIVTTPPPPKTGILWVISEPAGAEVFVNGTFKGVTPLRLDGVNAGNYTLKVVLSGYESQTKTVTVVGEQTNKFTFTLKKIATKPAILKVTTIPEGAEVYIDGLLVGISNNSFTISEGTHEILIRLEGYQDYVATITVKGGEVRTISVTLKEK